MILLKQSTAATLRVGPFVDATDAVTPETGITLGAADQAELLKHSGATVDISGATWAAVTGCDGYYDLSLTTSHTDTLGMLTVVVQDASVCIPAPAVRAMVVPAQVYDSLVGGTDLLDVNTSQLGGTSQTGRDIGASVLLSSGTGTGQVSLSNGRVLIQSGVQRAAALTKLQFTMVDSSGGLLTGLTVAGTVSKDGGTYASLTDTVTEVANGTYEVDVSSAEMDAANVALRFTATGAADRNITIRTDP